MCVCVRDRGRERNYMINELRVNTHINWICKTLTDTQLKINNYLSFCTNQSSQFQICNYVGKFVESWLYSQSTQLSWYVRYLTGHCTNVATTTTIHDQETDENIKINNNSNCHVICTKRECRTILGCAISCKPQPINKTRAYKHGIDHR